MTLVVLCPLGIEAWAVRGLPVRVTGMGARTADVAADTVCIAGFCGAASPELAPGDVVLATEVRSRDGTRTCEASPLLEEPLQRLGLRVTTGPIYSTDHVAGPAERESLGGSGVLAVDMESYWLTEAAGGIPVAVVRVVVDRAGRRLLHPATLPAGVRAFRALRRTAPALAALDRLPQPEPLPY